MSDIDLIKHCRVGIFGQIPVYLCLEDGCWIGRQKVCEPSSIARRHALCIGGGSGEHPALVINSPKNCVAIYLRHAGILNIDIEKCAKQRTDGYMTFCDGMTRSQWMAQFKDDYEIWQARMSFERWVATVIGEFTYFMLHELYPTIKPWRRYAKEIYSNWHYVLVPWDKYEGNGLDYFEVSRRKPNQAL